MVRIPKCFHLMMQNLTYCLFRQVAARAVLGGRDSRGREPRGREPRGRRVVVMVCVRVQVCQHHVAVRRSSDEMALENCSSDLVFVK